MPIGHEADPHSARGIIVGLAGSAQVLLALSEHLIGQPADLQIWGCALGAILTEALLDAYRLRDYGANVGDALLAYIGLAPAAQGSRVRALDDSIIKLTTNAFLSSEPAGGQSLAGLMFAS